MQPKIDFIINTIYATFIMAILVLGLKYILPCILPFVLGFGIAYLLRPIVEYTHKKLKLPYRLGAMAVILLFYTLAGISLWLLVAYLAGQLTIVASYLPTLYTEYIIENSGNFYTAIGDTISRFLPDAAQSINSFMDTLFAAAKELVSAISIQIVEMVTSLARNTPIYMVAIIFTIISSILISRDYDGVKSIIKAGVPEKWHRVFVSMADFMKSTVYSMIKGYIIIMAITFIELIFGLWLLGVERFISLSALVAVLDILPLIGSGLILLPWGIWCLITGDYFIGWGILILYAIISFVRNIIEPKIIGDQIGLGPLATITAMFFGLRAIGFVGMLIAPIILLGVIHFVKISGNKL